MNQKKKNVETVALSRNKLYRTYQFHGTLGKGKKPEEVMEEAVKAIFSWLQSRFRQFDSVPEEIRKPELGTFRISDGYIIESVYLPERNSWSFRLTEPDMGTADRDPVPGRLFMTNYGLGIVDGCVEFGAKIICAQPEDISQDAEVFRPKIIRDLQESLGLFSVVDLCYEGGNLKDQGARRKLDKLLQAAERNMPIVVVEKKAFSVKDLELAADPINRRGDFVSTYKMGNPAVGGVTEKVPGQAFDYREMINKWARSFCGIAYVFLNEAGKENRISVSNKEGQTVELFNGEILTEANERRIMKKVKAEVGDYSKRLDDFYYGNVIFISQANKIKHSEDLKKLIGKEDFKAENENLKKQIADLEEAMSRAKQLSRDFSLKLQEEKEERAAQEHRHKINLNMLGAKKDELEKQLAEVDRKLGRQEEEINRHRAREKRPKDMNGFIKWVESYYPADILLLTRAKNELKKAKNYDLRMICDGIEVLAESYKKWRTGAISESEYTEGCMALTKSSFTISLTGEASMKRYSSDYTVNYQAESGEDPGKRKLDMHLKYGVDSQNLLRIYFFWDDEREKVVIGSLPDHLRSV